MQHKSATTGGGLRQYQGGRGKSRLAAAIQHRDIARKRLADRRMWNNEEQTRSLYNKITQRTPGILFFG